MDMNINIQLFMSMTSDHSALRTVETGWSFSTPTRAAGEAFCHNDRILFFRAGAPQSSMKNNAPTETKIPNKPF